MMAVHLFIIRWKIHANEHGGKTIMWECGRNACLFQGVKVLLASSQSVWWLESQTQFHVELRQT